MELAAEEILEQAHKVSYGVRVVITTVVAFPQIHNCQHKVKLGNQPRAV